MLVKNKHETEMKEVKAKLAETEKALAEASIRSFMDSMQRIGYTRADIIRLLESSEKEDNNGNT